VQGHWDDGFKLLLLGNDAKLRKLADLELQPVNEPEINDLKRGDLWWDYAQQANDLDKLAATGRAKFWYSKAVITLRGLDRTNAEKKLTFTANGIEYRSGIVSEQFTPLLSGKKTKGTLEYSVDFTAVDDPLSTARTVGVKWTGALLPPTAGRYTLIAEMKQLVRVTIGTKPDERKIIEVTPKTPNGKHDASVYLSDRPIALVVEFEGPTRRDGGLKLKWIRPGSKVEELIPASAFYHNKTDDKLITER
jgi:hypothetical protein